MLETPAPCHRDASRPTMCERERRVDPEGWLVCRYCSAIWPPELLGRDWLPQTCVGIGR